MAAWVGVAAFAITLMGIASAFTYIYVLARSRHIELDAQLCPVQGFSSQTAVLIDTTDEIADVTELNLQTWLRDTALGIEKGGFFEISALTTEPPYTHELFSLCNPGDGADLDALTGNTALARQRWEASFGDPLLVAIGKAVQANNADTSPIMAGIQSIAVRHLASQKNRSAPARVIVVSDMLENTEFFSHYRKGADFPAFEASPAASRFATDLAGAEASIWLIRRPKQPIDGVLLVNFWKEWIEYNHGVFGSARPLQGVQG